MNLYYYTLLFILYFTFEFVQTQNDDVIGGFKDKTNRTYMIEEDSFFGRILNGYQKDKSPYDILSKEQKMITFGTPPTIVKLTINLQHIRIPQTMSPTVKYNAMIIEEWTDSRIGWNPSDFNGRKSAALPVGYNIWTPQVYSYARGYLPATVIHGLRAPRYRMKIDEKNQYQAAHIDMKVRHDGVMDCDITGSFPFEHFSCVSRYILNHRTYEIGMRVHGRDILLKTIDMKDDDRNSMNGWKVHSATQKLMIYNRFLEPNPFRETKNQTSSSYRGIKKNEGYAVELRLELSRSMSSIAIITILPFTIVAILILSAWIIPIRWCKFYLVALVYILLIITKNCLYKVPSYHDRFGGLDLMAFSLWITLFISLMLHLLFDNFPSQIKQIGIRFESFVYSVLPTLKDCLQKWDERRLEHLSEEDSYPLGMELMRIFLLLLQVVILFIITIISLL